MIKEIINRGRTPGIAIGITIILLMLIMPVEAASGNRVWKEGMPTTYTWDSHSFAGFYYNLDENLGTEELTINNIKRTIDPGDLTYTTMPIEVEFEHPGFGKYQVIGFMADKYFAGYTGNSIISGGSTISTLGRSQLHKVIIDDDDKRVINEGGTLTLKEGYVLKMTAVDIGAGPGQIMVTLLKDGTEVDTGVIAGNSNYIYSEKLGAVKDMPVLAVHFDSVFRGREVNAAFIRGVFQISEAFTNINSGDRYGELEISSVGSGGIDMSNRNSLSLSSGNTVDLVGDLKIVVADSSTLRFALSVERTGAFEMRGTTYPETSEWDPMNFGLNIGGTNLGFYYDMDRDVGNEKLTIEQINGRTIPNGKLRYSTTADEINFDYPQFGTYKVIGFMADRYFAGYTAGSVITKNQPISTLGRDRLYKILIDDDTKRTLTQGGTLTLKDGYVLKITDVDIGAGAGQVLLSLLKDGVQVDSDVVTGNDNYVLSRSMGSVDLPIISVHFDAIFRGREVNAAFFFFVLEISDIYTSITSNDKFGEMEVETVNSDRIDMVNKNSLSMSSGDTVDIMGNIKFKVANSDTVRFYPFVYVTPDMISSQLSIDAPDKATAGDEIMVKVTAGGQPVEAAFISINSEFGQTDINGLLNVSLKKTMKGGTYNISVTKLGYQKASKELVVQDYVEDRLGIEAPEKGNQFGNITIRVMNKGQPVAGATVNYDDKVIGSTDAAGNLIYRLENSGTHTIYASKSGFATAARDIEVRVPYAEFKALDIRVNNVVISNEKVEVQTNITNVGTKGDTLPVGLIINSTEIVSMPVTIAAGEVKEVTFTKEVNLPPGNYTVEVLGQKKIVEVREAPFNIFLALLVIIVIGAVVIFLLTKGRTRSGTAKDQPVEGEIKKK
ncbi:S-layer protein [uncultured archaeon]|nr:S-layer protein [uncultured archaeon]